MFDGTSISPEAVTRFRFGPPSLWASLHLQFQGACFQLSLYCVLDTTIVWATNQHVKQSQPGSCWENLANLGVQCELPTTSFSGCLAQESCREGLETPMVSVRWACLVLAPWADPRTKYPSKFVQFAFRYKFERVHTISKINKPYVLLSVPLTLKANKPVKAFEHDCQQCL